MNLVFCDCMLEVMSNDSTQIRSFGRNCALNGLRVRAYNSSRISKEIKQVLKKICNFKSSKTRTRLFFSDLYFHNLVLRRIGDLQRLAVMLDTDDLCEMSANVLACFPARAPCWAIFVRLSAWKNRGPQQMRQSPHCLEVVCKFRFGKWRRTAIARLPRFDQPA